MSKVSILYIFRRPVKNDLNLLRTGKTTRDIFYGLTEVRFKYFIYTTDQVFKHKFLLLCQYFINLIVLRFLDIGFSIIPVLLLYGVLSKPKIIFATSDTYGLPLALLKRIGVLNKPIIYNTVGLYDALLMKNNPLAIRFCRFILKKVDIFISGGSYQECKKLSYLLNIPISKFIFIPFGIDTNFFKPEKREADNEILIIGADPSRDWPLYYVIARQFSQEKFRIVTFQNIVKIIMPDNIVFEYNLQYTQLRERIWESKFVLILSKFNYHFAGQSTAMRVMSCEKAVIFTQTPGVEEYEFKDKIHCMLVPPGDKKAVVNAINYLNKYKNKRQKIGKAARRIITKKYSIEKYGNRMLKAIDSMNF